MRAPMRRKNRPLRRLRTKFDSSRHFFPSSCTSFSTSPTLSGPTATAWISLRQGCCYEANVHLSKGGGEAVDEAAVRLNDLIRLRALVAPSQAECGKRAQLEASEEADTQAVANALPSNSIELLK